jgi:hypothetical protein
MKQKAWVMLAAASALALPLAGCSTLDIRTPAGMFLSTGDYVPGITTLGVIQESTTVFAPLFRIDVNKVNQGLYETLIRRGKEVGADGITNVRFSWKPSPSSYLTLAIASGVFDFYVEGIVIKKMSVASVRIDPHHSIQELNRLSLLWRLIYSPRHQGGCHAHSLFDRHRCRGELREGRGL